LIKVENQHGVGRGIRTLTLDGTPQEGTAVPLVDDGAVHEVHAIMGSL
jgi:hypothetical protein